MIEPAKPGSRKAVRGVCRSCGIEYALTVTGRVRMHPVPGALTECEGSRRAPASGVRNRLGQMSIEEILMAEPQMRSDIRPAARPAAQAKQQQTAPEPARAMPQPTAAKPAEPAPVSPAFVPVHYPDILTRGDTGSGWDNVCWAGQHA